MLKRPPHFPGGAALTAVLLFQEHFAHITGKHEAEQLAGGGGNDSQEEQDKLSLPPLPTRLSTLAKANT